MNHSRSFRTVRILVFLAAAIYFFGPLLAMLKYSLNVRGDRTSYTLDNWTFMVTDEGLRSAIIASLLLAVFTVLLMLVLLVPTMVWVRLRVPKINRLIEFLCLLPLTIPALVIVVGINDVYSWVNYFLGSSPLTLTFAYVVLVLPYCYRAIDSALSSIDVGTLSEAARSLGAGWFTVITRIVMPNITSGMLGAAFISVALVLGEFTFASLLHFDTLPVAMAALYKLNPAAAMAAALASMILVAVLLVGLTFLGQRRGADPATAGQPKLKDGN